MTKKITPEMREQLRAPLPDEAISQHPTKPYLSSIKAIYVTERMNEVFGVGAWRYKVELEGQVTAKGMVVVKVTYEIPEYGVYYECFGGNDNGGTANTNFDIGDAYKGATTDALTKIGSYLEIGLAVFKGKQKGVSKLAAEPQAIQSGYFGKCLKCGAPNAKSQSTGKIFCSKKCWLTPVPSQEVPPVPEYPDGWAVEEERPF